MGLLSKVLTMDGQAQGVANSLPVALINYALPAGRPGVKATAADEAVMAMRSEFWTQIPAH